MNFHHSVKHIIALLTITLHNLPPIRAFGYAKCFLTYKNIEYANCINQGVVNLRESIQHLPNQTLWLNASWNKINVLEDKVFIHLPKLLELRLNRNQISTIHSGAFYNLYSLYILDLSNNLIQSFQNVDTKDLKSLQILLLSNNKMRTIENVQWNHFNVLQELDLSFNQISDFRTVAQAVKHLNMLYNLNMSSNSIVDLRSNQTLVVLPSLNILDLSKNLISVLDLSELHMPNLTSLNLLRNNLNAINGSTFINVPNLTDITFDENPLNLSMLLQTEIPNLTNLHWSSMRPALDSDLFIACQVLQSFPKLNMLDIKHSKILASKLQVIGGCTNLTSLILSTGALEQLESTELQSFTYLEVLYLDKCKLRRIQNTTWIGLEALHTLILERNVLSYLPDYLFSPLINLQYLDLSKNHLSYINPKTFFNVNKLTHLFLQSCQIVAINHDSFSHLWNLRHLDLQENIIAKLKSKAFKKQYRLQTLLLSGNKIHIIQKYGLDGLKSLNTLSLSNNKIYKFSDNIFQGLNFLIHLNISGNEWSFYKHDSKNPFKMLKILETLDISYQVRRYEDSVSETFFEGLGSLQKLYIRGIPVSYFKNVSFAPLTNLTDLDLSGSLQSTDQHSISEFIHKFSQLRYLTIDNNNIQDLPEDTFAHLKTLENLSLRNNKLRNISQKLLTPLTNLSYFDAYMNPLSCFCENYWFQNWSQFNTKVQVPFVQSYNCFGKVASDMKFVNQDLSFCGTDISVFFFIGSFNLTLLFIVTSLVISKLKWSIHYLYYIARAWWQWKLQKEDRIYKYDAYISYCSEDEEWVIKELLSHLECQGKRKYKMCFKSRDFMPGVYHIDNIQDAINNSRKTLCVISRNYLENQWCRMEIEMACSKVFYQREDVLLVVFLENIPDYRLSAYHKLRKLIKQNTYINLPEDPQGHELFWFKLRKALDSGVYEEDNIQLSVAS